MNQSVHAIDLLQWIAGPVVQRARGITHYAASRIHPKIEVEDTLSASLRFENGRIRDHHGHDRDVSPAARKQADLRSAEKTEPPFLTRACAFSSFATSGRATRSWSSCVNATAANLTRRRAGSAADIGMDLHARNISAILAAWDEGRDAETSGEEGRKSVSIINALYESARSDGMPVDVK